MIRQTALLLFAVLCIAPHLAFANDDDADLLDSPLFALSDDTNAQPQRSLLATAPTTGSYTGGYVGGYYGGYYGGAPPAPAPAPVCKPGKDYEVYFIAIPGTISISKRTGKPRVGVFRDKTLVPALKKVAKQYGLSWKLGKNYSRCVVKKTRAFTKKTFHYRAVCNLSDVPCKVRPGLRNSLRNAAKRPRGKVILIVANNA